jgi:hypothetical protein
MCAFPARNWLERPNLKLRSGSTVDNLGPSAYGISIRPQIPSAGSFWTSCRRGSSGRVPCVPPVDGNLPRLRVFVNQIHKTAPIVLVSFPITDPRQFLFWGFTAWQKKPLRSVLVPSCTLVRSPPAGGSDHRKLVALLKCIS